MLLHLFIFVLVASPWVQAANNSPRLHRQRALRLAPRTNANPEWQYVGCVKDAESLRALNGSSQSSGSNTPDQCIEKCNRAGYKLAGMQYGVQCYCGTTLSASGTTAPEADCSMPCGGDKSQKCGGQWRMSLYSKYDPTYMGCYADQSSPRTLANVGPDSASMTTQTCKTSCINKGYSYAGTAYGRQCWCSKTAPLSSRVVAEKDCNMPCMGDQSQTCGGTWRLSVYDVSKAIVSSASSSKATSSKTTSTTSSKASSTSTTTSTAKVTPSTTSKVSTASSSTVASTASITTSAAGPGVTAAGGSVAPKSANKKAVYAHHMIGNTFSYTSKEWASDISMAAAAGIDGFALNIGDDDYMWAHVADAYAAAKAFGPSFKLFISFDMNVLKCGSPSDGSALRQWVSEYHNHPNQAYANNGKQLASTFAGGLCYFGQGSVNDGWMTQFRAPLEAQNISLHFVPADFSDVSTFSSSAWLDGVFAWNAGWPMGAANLDTSEDRRYLNALGSKSYMAPISPAFFTYYGPSSWNKNWIYRSDNWLLATRFEDVISMRDKIDLIELITWNDYGESHYLGPIRVDQPYSQGWTNGMPHTAWLKLVSYYANVFRTGSYNTPTSDTLILWSRPHPKSAQPSAPTMGRPANADYTDDNLYAVVMLKAAATVTIYSGSTSQTWIAPAGLTKLRVSSAAGAIGGKILRGGAQVAAYDSTGSFSYNLSPVDYNFNYFVAST